MKILQTLFSKSKAADSDAKHVNLASASTNVLIDEDRENDSLYSRLEELVAYRFHLRQRKLNPQQQLLAKSIGNHHATRKGRGMTFSEVRQYQPSDDIRHIDWRVTARTQKPHTKVFVEEHERPTFLVTEQSPALFFGSKVRLKTAQSLNISAVLAWCSLHQNERVGGIAFNGQHSTWVSPKRSQKAVLSYLQQTIRLQKKLYRPASPQGYYWQQALQQLAKAAKPGAQVFLIGDMLTLAEHAYTPLQTLKRHLDIVAIHVVDPLEKQLPQLGWLSLTRTFGDDSIHLDSFRSKTRQDYQQTYETQWHATEQKFRQQQIPLFEIHNDEPAIQQLIKHRIIV